MQPNSGLPTGKRKERLSLKISLIYALLGSSWIFISDKLMEMFTTDSESAARISMIKGVAFILLTAIVIYIITRRDMLRLLETETALRKSEAQYRELVENANSIILRLDTMGDLTFINEYGRRFFGCEEEELIGRNLTGLIVPEDGSVADALWGKPLEGCKGDGRPGKIVCETVLGCGERVWIAWTSKPVGKKGQVEEYLCVGLDITEQKQAEDALKRAYLLLRTQQEASINAVLSVDEKGRVISSNRLFSAMWGLPAELTAEGGDFRPVLEAIAQKVIGAGEFFQTMLRVHSGGGETGIKEIRLLDGRVFEGYSAPLNGEDGKFYGRVCHFRDITERKLMEGKVAEAEAKYRDIFENSVVGIYQVAPDGRIMTVNMTIANILGYASPEEMYQNINHDAFKLYLNPERRSELIRLIEERGIAREFLTEFLRKDKSVVWVSLDTRAVRDENGAIRYFEGVLRDVTRQKAMQEAVARAEEKYRNIFENSLMGIFQLGMDGRFLSLNKALACALGYESPEDAAAGIGRVERLFARPERLAELIELISHQGLVEQFEVELFRKDGSVMWGSLNINVVRGGDGKISFFEGALQDITDSKRLRAQLDQAQKMEAIGTLAGGIAHDFNNILTPIIGYAELSLISAGEDSRLERNMKQILLSANRAKELVKRILAFSRKSGHEREPVRVGLIIGEVLDLLRSSLPATIEIRKAVEEDAVQSTIMAEPAQVHQVLMNLCTNAAQAMRAKGGVLTAGLANTRIDRPEEIGAPDISPGVYLRLTVSDTGHGMEEAVKERIFDPYFTTKGPDEGTGLGLAVVYGIVKNLCGAITVSSVPGQGATFCVYLPATRTTPLPSAPMAAPLRAGSGLVLLVDDEIPIVDMNREMLENLGYRVVGTHNGAEALDAFMRNPLGFDAVITDMTMPGLTGAELAVEILSIRADIPIILCTGFSESLDQEKAKAMGVRAFLMKPVSMLDLTSVLGSVLKKVAGSREESGG